MNSFALVELDSFDEVTSRYALELITNPSGFGFSITTSTIQTDIEEILVKATQSLKTVKLQLNYAKVNQYAKARALSRWISYRMNKRTALEWTNDSGVYYADCTVTDFDITEKTEYKFLSVPITIKMRSPFFQSVVNEIELYPSVSSKTYPYTYPYTYGIGVISNNSITNEYIQPIPLIVKLSGAMGDVYCSIKISGEDTAYQTVSFPNLTLLDGDYIIINAVTRKIIYYDGVSEQDGYNLLDASKDSFIYAEANETSEISAAIVSNKTGSLKASYRKYML